MRESRVTRILRDARAAVAHVSRPTTPRDESFASRAAKPRLEPLNATQPRAPVHEAGLPSVAETLRSGSASEVIAACAQLASCDGSYSEPDLRSSGVVDALVRALDGARDAYVVTDVLASVRDMLVLYPALDNSFYTSGLLPSLSRACQSELVSGVTRGNFAIVCRLLAVNFSRGLIKFDLLDACVDMTLQEATEVLTIAVVGCFGKVVQEVPDFSPSSSQLGLMVRCLEKDCGQYVRAQCLYVLARLSDAHDVAGTLIRKHPAFVERLGDILDQTTDAARRCALQFMLHLSATETRSTRLFEPWPRYLFNTLASVPMNSQEMLLTLAVLSNATFHVTLADVGDDIADSLSGILFEGDDGCVVEATRMCGNLTRSKSVCECFVGLRLHEVFAELTAHPDVRVVFNVLGVLVNLTAMAVVPHQAELVDIAQVEKRYPEEVEVLEVCQALRSNVTS